MCEARPTESHLHREEAQIEHGILTIDGVDPDYAHAVSRRGSSGVVAALSSILSDERGSRWVNSCAAEAEAELVCEAARSRLAPSGMNPGACTTQEEGRTEVCGEAGV